MTIFNWTIFAIVLLLTYIGVEIFRRWSLRRNLFDVPNERSLHFEPTVIGGGFIIVSICLTVYVLQGLTSHNEIRYGYLAGALMIAAISWLDDLRSVPFGWRFAVHTIAAFLVVFTLGYFQTIEMFSALTINLGAFGAVLTVLWIIWMTNAYNFMDGIDGIAGMQALTAGIGWFLLGWILDFPATGFYGGVIAFSALGFLIHNWQPAKIFMGDVGSAFLGYTFAVMPLLAKNEIGQASENSDRLWFFGIILVGLFVFDTIFTFVRRGFKREKVWEAHRSHIYQRLVLKGYSHRTVAALYGIVSALAAGLLIFVIL